MRRRRICMLLRGLDIKPFECFSFWVWVWCGYGTLYEDEDHDDYHMYSCMHYFWVSGFKFIIRVGALVCGPAGSRCPS